MATAIHTLIAPAAATLSMAANDNRRPWTADPRAAALLASCVTHPPVGMWHRTTYALTRDEHFAYAGYRAEALEAIRMAHGDRLLTEYHRVGDAAYDAFNDWCRQPTATDAIDAAMVDGVALLRGEG